MPLNNAYIVLTFLYMNFFDQQGFLKAGYNRIDIDDCYMSARDPVTNDLTADPTRFPGGIEALSAKIHGLGLKFGSCASTTPPVSQESIAHHVGRACGVACHDDPN